MGFGVGGVSIPFDLLAEFLPSSHRGSFLMCIQYFWTFGSLFVAGMAWMLLETQGWRVLTLCTAVPITLNSYFAFVYLPESPKWLACNGRKSEAEEIIRHVARVNGVRMVPFRLPDESTSSSSSEESQAETGSYLDLIATKQLRRTSFSLWTIWGIFGFTYNGLILFVSRLYNTGGSHTYITTGRPGLTCNFNYERIFFNASAEIAGVSLSCLLINMCRPITAQSFFYLLSGVTVYCMGISISPSWLDIVAMIGRGCIMAASV